VFTFSRNERSSSREYADLLKIDKCFIRDIGKDQFDEDIIKIIVAIARTMDIQVIAEGVETEEQLGFLSSIGCELIQGWFFSKALDASSATALIENIESSLTEYFDKMHTYMKRNDIHAINSNRVH